MKQMNLRVMNDNNWRQMGKRELMEKGYFPNRIFVNNRDKIVVINVERAEGGDFSINQSVLEKCSSLNGDYTCYIRLTNKDKTYVNQDTVGNFMRKIRTAAPNSGNFGPYFWVKDDFELSSPGDNMREEWPI